MDRSIVILAKLDEIPRVSIAIEEAMRACAFPEEAILDLQLAVEEALANTILHGYRDTSGEVSIAIQATQEAVQVRIEDHAPPFDPLSLLEPERGSDLARRRIGGLGVYLMRQVVDEVRYQYIEGKNVLTLTKRTSA
jgi:serine/threonine-protein kinase RsbW